MIIFLTIVVIALAILVGILFYNQGYFEDELTTTQKGVSDKAEGWQVRQVRTELGNSIDRAFREINEQKDAIKQLKSQVALNSPPTNELRFAGGWFLNYMSPSDHPIGKVVSAILSHLNLRVGETPATESKVVLKPVETIKVSVPNKYTVGKRSK